MADTIHKYPLQFKDLQKLRIPIVQILTIQKQLTQWGEGFMMWAKIDPSPEAQIHTVTIHLVGTGHDIPDKAINYITTVQDGGFVWHFFSE